MSTLARPGASLAPYIVMQPGRVSRSGCQKRERVPTGASIELTAPFQTRNRSATLDRRAGRGQWVETD
jgi:hypothetical protein